MPSTSSRSKKIAEKSNDDGHKEYLLGKYPEALAKAFISAMGQKSLIKKLYSDCDEVVAQCPVRELRKATYQPTFLASIEGRKLLAVFAPKIGVTTLWKDMKGIVIMPNTASVLCEHYGEVLLWIWKRADGDEEVMAIESCLIDAVYYALCSEANVARKFTTLLRPIRKGTSRQMDDTIFRIMRPNLWRCLKARSAKVRLNAIILLTVFYPIMTNNDFENEEYLERQREVFREFLFDDSYDVRAVTCKGALSILGSYWITFDNDYIRDLLSKVVDKLSKDSIVAVRVAVFESLHFLLPCPQAVNVLERSLKCLIPRGINDKSERVRLAAFHLLTVLGKHRFIRFWEVVDVEHILQCFEVEESESVRKQITKLLLRSFKSMDIDADETIRRILFMGAITRSGALSFHRLIVTMGLITVEEALEHVQILAIALCKMLRSMSNVDESLASFNDLSLSMGSSCTSLTRIAISGDEKETSEIAQRWSSCTLLVECVTVMWVVLRKRIQDDRFKAERRRTTNILSKLFKMLFTSFKNSSIIDSIMALGSALSEQVDVSAVVLQELVSAEPIDEWRLLPYLEVAASWHFAPILDFVHSGLSTIASAIDGAKVPIKRSKRRKCSPKCGFGRALQYLELVLKSPMMQQNLIANHGTYMQMFHTALLPINAIIEAKLDDTSDEVFKNRCHQMPLEDILRAYEIRHTLAIIMLNTLEDEEHRRQIEELLGEDATWVVDRVMPKLVSVTEPDETFFLVTFCQSALRMFSYHLGSYSHSTHFKRIVADSVVILSGENTPTVFIISVMKTLKYLCRAADSDEDEELMLETIVPLTRSCLLWMSKRVDDDDFDMKGCSESFLSLMRELKAQRRLSQNVLDEYAKCIVAAIIPVLMQINENELDISDPRDNNLMTSPLMELLLQRIAMKNPLIHSAMMNALLTMLNSKAFVDRYNNEDILYAYGAITQLVLMSKPGKGQQAGVMAAAMTHYASQRTACMEAICRRLEELAEPAGTHQLRDRILQLCGQ